MDFQSVISMFLNFLMKSSVFLGTLSILVVLHELGHFIAARLSGVNVLDINFSGFIVAEDSILNRSEMKKDTETLCPFLVEQKANYTFALANSERNSEMIVS